MTRSGPGVTRAGGDLSTDGAWRFAPDLYRLRHYERAWLRPDVLAGIAVAAYLIPQVMAYAEVAGLPPVVGLWAICAAAARLRLARLVAAAVGRARSRPPR